MRTRPPDLSQADLDRRLAQLRNDLAGVRPARAPSRPEAADASWWDEHTRPAAPRHAPPAPPAARPLPGPAARHPGPGRHLADRAHLSLGAPQLAVVAIVIALGLAVTAWWLVRGSAHPADDLAAAPARALVSDAPAVEPVAEAPASSPSAATAAPGPGPATVTVDVAGKVRHPGIAVLDAGARVVDALEAAGGAKPGVDLTGLNLARVLVDGEQVVVGAAPPTGLAAAASPPPAGSSGGAAPAGAPAAVVNLNTATEADLDTLPDVGPVTAQSILTWRDQHGGFTSVDELLEVDGIGEVTLGKLAPYVTV
jgi:competence protein ComEA